jgi:hypothetical protein
MSIGEIHLNDIGTLFIATVKDEAGVAVDISTATVKRILFHPPDGALVTKAGAFSTTGVDGKLQYMTVAGDLSLVGNWSYQVYVEMPAGKWHSDVATFRVYENLT